MRLPDETRNLDRSGNPIIPWRRPLALLEAGIFLNNGFLSTVNRDGRPHTTGIGAVWLDDDIYFTSGAGTRKARNLARNPACTLAARLPTIDVVFEGEARPVEHAALLERVAARLRAGGWPVEVSDGGVSAPYAAPSAGPPPWTVFCLRFHTAVGNATAAPEGATRWRWQE